MNTENQNVDVSQNVNASPDINNAPSENSPKKSFSKGAIVLILICLLIAGGVALYFFKDSLFGNKNATNNTTNTTNTTPAELKLSYRLNGNGLNDFDIAFMQIENNGKNKVYSPLSIKYALYMLDEAADGDTKSQLDAVLGDYKVYTYPNSANMSFANAMFIKNDYKQKVLSSYVDTLESKYNAEVKFDSFEKPDALNNWIKEKTLKLIDKMFDDSISEYDYFLVNALAIDMEWVNKIQSKTEFNGIYLKNESVKLKDCDSCKSFEVPSLNGGGYGQMVFEGTDKKAATVDIKIVANKYDIISELGEDNIRKTVQAEYEKWLETAEDWEKRNDDFNLDTYVKELKTNYEKYMRSTDLLYYDNDDVKVFAKDLKTYNSKTLQYVGIMPKTDSLVDYVKNTDASKLNMIVSNLKTVDYNDFEEGYLTYIHAQMPLFEYEYELSLLEDLKTMGIKDAFDKEKANLTKMTSAPSYIASAKHKANIKFSNDGIKASAATTFGGRGAAGGGFKYYFDIPVKEIDLTFDRPYMYIIRDKDTGEVWFAGTVYEPLEYSNSLVKEW